MISGFCQKATENCAPLGYYTASSGNILINYIITLFNNQSLNLTASFANTKTHFPVLQYKQLLNLTFRGPCIVIYSYNKNRQDALFLNAILVKNSTCFGQTYCPSSGVLILYSQQLVSHQSHWLSANKVPTSLADSQRNWCDKYHLLWIQQLVFVTLVMLLVRLQVLQTRV